MQQSAESLYQELKKSIDSKYEEVQGTIDTSKKFYKIYQLEGNAVGQIGEAFLKKVIAGITTLDTDITEIIHDEYDIRTKSGVTFEVKTARYGRNCSFQFNGINPSYNVDYIICLGICEDTAVYRIITKREEVVYVHNKRGHYVINPDFSKKLVQMNPGNDVNYKLTLSLEQMYSIENLVHDLKRKIHSFEYRRNAQKSAQIINYGTINNDNSKHITIK